MCRSNKTASCLCHLIQPLLIADKEQNVRTTYFVPYAIEECYDFLKEAYALITLKVKINEVSSKLQKLVDDYLTNESPKSINVNNEQYKKEFLTAYEQFCSQKIKKMELYVKLETLINDIQKLVYNNTSDNTGFTALLVSLNAKSERRHSLTLMAPPKDDVPSRESKKTDTPRSKEESNKDSINCSIM
ncbi:hypothetical protein [uncultured Legionella sp.]|uniref:hypothetical protein n=1 Tax=uncultured Legionella sp. TaxID=210934 RepID=UPI002619B74E|nr:hypothetical protein [uncultured Legionella sp.]